MLSIHIKLNVCVNSGHSVLVVFIYVFKLCDILRAVPHFQFSFGVLMFA